MASRLYGIIAKEFIQLWRDGLALTLALFVPVAMLFIFGWAINTDVKHVTTAVFDQSGSGEARTLLEALANSQYFDLRHWTRSQGELTRLIDAGQAKVGIVIPPTSRASSPAAAPACRWWSTPPTPRWPRRR